jgi:hypothetical protein
MSMYVLDTTTLGCTKVQIISSWSAVSTVLHVTAHGGGDTYDVDNFRPCLARKNYSPYNRWHVIEAARAFGLDVLDDYLPFAIESPDTVVYAVAPLVPDQVRLLKSFYGGMGYGDAAHPPVAAFPVLELPRSKDDLLMFAKAAQDAYQYGPASEAVVLLGVKTELLGPPTTLWWITDLRNYQVDLLVSLYRFFFKSLSGLPELRYSVTKSWRPVEHEYASAPFRSPGGYEPFTRWEIVEMVHNFGLDVMDDVLPYPITNDYEVVYAMLPNDEMSVEAYRAYMLEYIYTPYSRPYVGIRVTNYVNTLDEFAEMLVRSSNNVILVNVLNKNKVREVHTSVLFSDMLQRSLLRRALQYGSTK